MTNTDTPAVAPKPCPFCGGDGKPVRQKWSGREYHGVSCDGDCLTFFDCRAATEAEAIAAWNRRAPAPDVREAVEVVSEWLSMAKDTPRPLHSSLNYVPISASEFESLDAIIALITKEPEG